MDSKKMELLMDLDEQIMTKEEEYDNEKIGLDTLEADYILLNDWESLLGKAKPTQKEKDSYITKETEARKRNVKKLERELKHLKRLYEIHMRDVKY